VLTGDTLFLGDVGRPDLLASGGLAPEDLARRVYRSLNDKLLTLPDSTRVYPAHGAGSACGKQMSSGSSSTIGEQGQLNYALQIRDEDTFLRAVLEGQGAMPAHFSYAAAENRHQHELLDDQVPPERLDSRRFRSAVDAGAAVLDTRSPDEYAACHLAGSLNVPLEGRFAEHAGSVLDPRGDVGVATDPGREAEAKLRLGRIGIDHVVGYLDGGGAGLRRLSGIGSTRRLAAEEAASLAGSDGVRFVDVRNPSEHELVVAGATLLPLRELPSRLGELDPVGTAVVYCATHLAAEAS
jgi:hydroxyacylglutathione hydrolase